MRASCTQTYELAIVLLISGIWEELLKIIELVVGSPFRFARQQLIIRESNLVHLSSQKILQVRLSLQSFLLKLLSLSAIFQVASVIKRLSLLVEHLILRLAWLLELKMRNFLLHLSEQSFQAIHLRGEVRRNLL